jgi:hypothetical protein
MRCAAGNAWRAYSGVVTHTAEGTVEWRSDGTTVSESAPRDRSVRRRPIRDPEIDELMA